MSTRHEYESQTMVHTLTRAYAALLLVLFSLSPAVAIVYLMGFVDPALRFEDHAFHEFAISVSMLQSGFIAYVTWRCYLQSGERFLRWLTLAFLGFAIVYGPHGAFTDSAHHNIWLFILYGPASRLVMAICLLAGLATYGRLEMDAERRTQRGFFLRWIGLFGLVDVLVYFLANSAWAPSARIAMEIAALCICLLCVAVLLARRIRSPLMVIYAVALMFFAQSSISFLLGRAWDHQWWLAHVIFASGFMILSYGVIQAFLTTRSFSHVYSQVELVSQLGAEKARAEKALLELQQVHKELAKTAATDPLTGAANRREFESRVASELARGARGGAPFSVLVVDLDHFKEVNDQHGHHAGDAVLEAVADAAKAMLRPSDVFGRLGGEEFALLLPDTERELAANVARRLRIKLENMVVTVGGKQVRVTASFGVAQYGLDGMSYDALLAAADSRMYRAKQEGRNRVVA